MTATAQTQRRLSVMTDINVLIIVGLRAGFVPRVLAKAEADSAADGITLSAFDSLSPIADIQAGSDQKPKRLQQFATHQQN